MPSAERVLILADRAHPAMPYPPGCTMVCADALGIPDFANFAFRYNPDEFRAALKPFAFRHILSQISVSHVMFFAPEIELFGPLQTVTQALADGAPFALTPQILSPAPDLHATKDLACLREGAFNLGFLGVTPTPQSRALLAWWARWLRWDCQDDAPIGMFKDQRFMDLIPGFADGVRILHDPGLNVGYWNLAQRQFAPDAPGGPAAGGSPLGFFHFAGYDPDRPDRLNAGAVLAPALRRFLDGYAARLGAAGRGAVPPQDYAYGRFASGTPIPSVARRMFRDDCPAWAGDPFDGFEAWAQLPALGAAQAEGSAVPSLMLQWLQARTPALAAMPITQPGGATHLVRWWLGSGAPGVDPRFIAPLALAAGQRPIRPTAPRNTTPSRPAMTVVGPLDDDSAAGAAARALMAAGPAHTVGLDILAAGSEPATGRLLAFCLTPDHLAPFLHTLRPRLPGDAYRVFVPAAEQAQISPAALAALQLMDEIWAPTRFLQAQLVLLTDAPVLHMPLAWEPPPPAAPSDGPYIVAECDGEDATAQQAFASAFADRPAPARLLAVTAPADPVLLAGAACLLSLQNHNALGLTVWRALAAGIPVVAADAGGGTEWLTPQTGWPVDSRDGAADPAHAAWQLRDVFARPEEALRRVAAGRQMVETARHPSAVAARLAALGLLTELAR